MHPHRSLFSQHPLAQLAVAFAAGIYGANYFQLKVSVSIGVVCSVLAVLLRKKLRLAGIMLLASVFFTGVVLAELEMRRQNPIRSSVEQPITITGWLDGPPEFARDRVYLSLRVEEPASGRVTLLARFTEVQLRYGMRVPSRPN